MLDILVDQDALISGAKVYTSDWHRWTDRLMTKLRGARISLYAVAGCYAELVRDDPARSSDARKSANGRASRPTTRLKKWLGGTVPQWRTAYRIGEAVRLAALRKTGVAWTSGLAALQAQGSWDRSLAIIGLALETPGFLRNRRYEDAIVAARAVRNQIYNMRSGDDAGLAARLCAPDGLLPQSDRFRAAINLASRQLIPGAEAVLRNWRRDFRPYFEHSLGDRLERNALGRSLREPVWPRVADPPLDREEVLLAAYLLDQPERILEVR